MLNKNPGFHREWLKKWNLNSREQRCLSPTVSLYVLVWVEGLIFGLERYTFR